MTGVYYSSPGFQHPNYRELLIPDLYADMMDRVSALLAAGGPKSFLNPGFLFTMFSEWSGLIQVLKLKKKHGTDFLKSYINIYLSPLQFVKTIFISRNTF